MDHQPSTESGLRELALFAGAGGGILGGKLLGWRTICAVEYEPYPASVLVARQNDGILAPFPIWDDVRTFDGKPWRGLVDVVSGGFPCQDISAAGKGAGIEGERSGLWSHMARIIGEVLPRYVFVENSPLLVGRGLGLVLGDLAEMGYDAQWGIVGADDAGAPHKRERIWIMANSNGMRKLQPQGVEQDQRGRIGYCGKDVADSEVKGWEGRDEQGAGRLDGRFGQSREPQQGWWKLEPDLGRVAHGVAARVDRLKAIGNGQVPSVAALAWRVLGGP